MHKPAIFLWLAGISVALGQQYSITTVAGGAPPPTPVAATSTSVGQPRRVAADSAGSVYFSSGNSVFKLSGTTLALLAGNSRAGYSGDGGPAVNAQLNSPVGLAVDAAGNVYIADSLNNRIRIVTKDGIINTFAGNGTIGYVNAVGDGGPANQAQLQLPAGVAVDSKGNVYIADTGDNLIREVTTDGNIATIAGNGYPSFSGDTALANQSSLNHPQDVAVDSSGNVYIADTLNAAIRKITSDGKINTVAGSASIGYKGDGGAATSAGLIEPYALAVDGSGNIFIAEPEDGRIRQVDGKANINTIAGNGTLGFGGDGSAATNAMFYLPTGVAVDSSGNVYIADSQNNRVRKLSGSTVSTVAGNGGLSYSGDGGAATKAQLNTPQAVAVDGAGNFYIADTANHVVRKVAANGTISTLAGTGAAGSGGSQLNSPQGVAVDSGGNVYISDTQNARVLKVAGGAVSTVAGSGTVGFGGDGGAAGSAQLNTPMGLAVDSAGNLYIADNGNHRIRKVIPGGAISTVAGNGNQGYSGDNGAATLAQLNAPQGVAVDSAGNLYIADTLNNRVRMVSGGNITTIAGTGLAGYTGDGGLASRAQLVNPAGLAVDSAGVLYVSDLSAHVRKIYVNGPIFTIAGSAAGYAGDGGLAGTANLNGPSGLAADSKGNVYIADSGNNAVRMLTPSGPGITVAAVTGAASNALGAIAPGEILVLYGSGMGPAKTVSNTFNSAGVISTSLAGTTVLVNGTPAPILYTGATQVAAIVPFFTTGKTAQVSVIYQGQVSTAVSAALAPAAPGIFTLDFSGKGQAAAINQDNSINGPAHAANAGTVVALYLTGGGQTNPGGTDGAQTSATSPPQPTLPVTATIGGKTATVSYAGAAPSSVAGVWQVNAQVPAGLSAGPVPVLVTVGGVPSQPGVTITVSGN
jgi:trimeric autotransporter adhesin